MSPFVGLDHHFIRQARPGRTTRPRALCRALVGAALAVMTTVAAGQAYPTKSIRLIVPFPAGAGDQVARLVSARLSNAIGQTVVVENMPGASGVIGTVAAIRSPADGYTLVTATNSMVNGPLLGLPTPFNALTDLTPIALTATGPSVLVTSPASPFRTIAQFVSLAKSKPGALSYASAGNGTLGHLYGEWFKAQAGIDVLHVPYKGGGPALTDVIGGQVSVVFDVLSSTRANVQGGKLRALAITSSARSSLLPDVPTMAEAGFPDFQAAAWFAMMAPAGTPRSVIDFMNAEVNKALKHPDVVTGLANLGLNAEGGPPERFTTLFNTETRRWGKVIKDAGIKAE